MRARVRVIAEALTARLRDAESSAPRQAPHLQSNRPRLARAPAPRHRVAYFGAMVETPVHDRAACAPGAHIDGPALIEEPESTLVVPPGWSAEVLGDGTFRLRT